jgi:GH24 family phage-related lysozyme (muramidase)
MNETTASSDDITEDSVPKGPTSALPVEHANIYEKPSASFPDLPYKDDGSMWHSGTSANLVDVRRGAMHLAKAIADNTQDFGLGKPVVRNDGLDALADSSYNEAMRRRYEQLINSGTYGRGALGKFDPRKLYVIAPPSGYYAERGTLKANPWIGYKDKDVGVRELAPDEWRAYARNNSAYSDGFIALPDITDAPGQLLAYSAESHEWDDKHPQATNIERKAHTDELSKKYPRRFLNNADMYGTGWHELVHMLTPNIYRTNDSHIFSPYAGAGGDVGIKNHGGDSSFYFANMSEQSIPALMLKNLYAVYTGEDLSRAGSPEEAYEKIFPLLSSFKFVDSKDPVNLSSNSDVMTQAEKDLLHGKDISDVNENIDASKKRLNDTFSYLGLPQVARLDRMYRTAAQSENATPEDKARYESWKRTLGYLIMLSKNNEGGFNNFDRATGVPMERKTAAYIRGYSDFMRKSAGYVMPWVANQQAQQPASPKENVASAARTVLSEYGYNIPGNEEEQPLGYSVTTSMPGSPLKLAPYTAGLQARANNIQKKWDTPGKKPDSVGSKTAEFVKKADPPHKGVNSPFYAPGEFDPMLDPEIFAYQPVPRKRGVLLPLENSRAGKEWTRILNRGSYIDPSKTMTGRYLSWLPDTPENANKRRSLSVDLNSYISTISRDVAANLIAGGEGYRKDAHRPLKNSNWTYGYGFEYKPDENWHMSGIRVGPGDTISREDANKYLKQLTWDMLEKARSGTKDWNTATYGERAALASYLYNKKGNKFLPSIARRLKAGGEALSKIIGEEFPKFVKANGIPIAGLVNRRLHDMAAAGVPDDHVVMSPASKEVKHISWEQAKRERPALTRKDRFNYAGN